MESVAPRHRLLAILSADGVGYSALMAADDQAALSALEAARGVFDAEIRSEGGRVVDMAGDSVLAVFDSVAGAVRCALVVQQSLADAPGQPAARLPFRIGIHLGDVIEKGDGTVYGDGVNIAARLQAMAPTHGTVVSASVQSSVTGRVAARFVDLGEQEVKNIPYRIRAFLAERGGTGDASEGHVHKSPGSFTHRTRWVLPSAAALGCAVTAGVAWLVLHDGPPGVGTSAPRTSRALEALIGKSIAVLPFDSPDSNPETQRFADGISDELNAALSEIPGLKVSARASSAFFKGKQLPVQEIASRLGVADVVTGSVRRNGTKIRLSVQLMSAADGLVLWSRAYERESGETPDMQLEIARSIAANLQVQIGQGELSGSGTTDREALNLYWQARRVLNEQGNEVAALALVKRAIEKDGQFVRARLLAIRAEVGSSRFTFGNRRDERLQKLIAAAEQIAARFPSMFEAQTTVAMALHAGWQIDASRNALQRALAIGTKTSEAALVRVTLEKEAGNMSAAIAALDEAIDLDPLSPSVLTTGAFLSLEAGRPDQALAYANRALDLSPQARFTLALKSTALARLGRRDEALEVADHLPGGPLTTYFGVTTLALLSQEDRLKAELANISETERHSFFHAYLLLRAGRGMDALNELDINAMTPGDFFGRMQYDPAWDPVRREPRFVSLLKQLGVSAFHDQAQAWRARHPSREPKGPVR